VASLQANQAISVGPAAASPHSPKVNGVHKVASPHKPHFLDASFKEAEETIARLLEEARVLKAKWSTMGRSASDVALVTKQLRTVLEKGKTSLDEIDCKVESTYRARVKGADMDEILPESRKSFAKNTALKTGDAENAATLVKQKSEPKSPVKTLVKTPMKKEVKMTPKKEEVDIKCEEDEEEDKSKPAEGSDHLVIFATEGEAVIKDVEKLGENIPAKLEKEEEGIQDVSVDELEVEDTILEQVNGHANQEEEEVEKEDEKEMKKSNGVQPDLMERSPLKDKAVSKESKPCNGNNADDDDTSESLKRDARKESESDSLNCTQEKES